MLKTICAFANSDVDGDKLYIGVEDTTLLVEILSNKINDRLGIIVDVAVKMDEDKS